MTIFVRLFSLLNNRERKHLFLLFFLVLVMASLDTLGVASIMPFITLLGNPEAIKINPILKMLFDAGKFEDEQSFLFFSGVLVLVILVSALALKAFTVYTTTRFALMAEYTIGRRLFAGYLGRSYAWFLSRNSADLSKSILSEVTTVINNGLLPLLLLFSQGAIAVALLILLLVVDPILALLVGSGLGTIYAGIYISMSTRLKLMGEARALANKSRFKAVSEAFGASKEVKVGGLEKTFLKRFEKPAKTYAVGFSNAQIIAQLPRYALEGVAFGGMMLVILYLVKKNGSFVNALPVIALYAFAAYRLLPAIQQIYGALTLLRFVGPGLNTLHKDLAALKDQGSHVLGGDSLPLQKFIQVDKVSYKYPNTSTAIIDNVTFKIPAYSTTAFVGTTGGGKTTLVDLIMGLLEPQKGSIFIDDKKIDPSNVRSWQKRIGYVPQHIYLSDDTVSANIAFGINDCDVDHDEVIRVSKVACLHNFVMNELPDRYDTIVGERGVRLSGGQRQRIGIARALYQSPELLVLDEATSALDNYTEKLVMEEVANLGEHITIITIAHRLSTVKKYDHIILLEQGKIVAEGRYEDLIEQNEKFRSIALVSN